MPRCRWSTWASLIRPSLAARDTPMNTMTTVPVVDTTLTDFSSPQLFTENRFSGGDRFGDANQVTAALTSRFLHANGQEAFRATIGQRYYFEDERVALSDTSPLR